MNNSTLLGKIPRTRGGAAKHPRLTEIARLLKTYAFTEKELRLLDQDIQFFVDRFGHEGVYAPKKSDWKR